MRKISIAEIIPNIQKDIDLRIEGGIVQRGSEITKSGGMLFVNMHRWVLTEEQVFGVGRNCLRTNGSIGKFRALITRKRKRKELPKAEIQLPNRKKIQSIQPHGRVRSFLLLGPGNELLSPLVIVVLPSPEVGYF